MLSSHGDFSRSLVCDGYINRVGRICNRLPMELANEVIASLLDCLTLAILSASSGNMLLL